LEGTVEAGAAVEVQLVMTKFGPPDVRLGWELRVES
jgi:hypothetical protein